MQVYFTVLSETTTIVLSGLLLGSIESVPRREEGSTGKYQHEVEGVPEGAAQGNYRDRMLVFFCTLESSQGTDIIQLIKVMKL